LRGIPGVESIAATDIVPISGSSWSNASWMDLQGTSARVEVLFNRASPDYFKTMGVQVLAGRTFDDRDVTGAPSVAIVNEAFARQMTSGTNPVGQRFWREQTPNEPETSYEIVGLVKNTKYVDLRENFYPIVFLPSWQDPRPDTQAEVLLSSDLPPSGLMPAVKSAVADVSSEIVIDFDNMQSVVRASLLRERMLALLSGFFGVLAALLSTLGLYGVISYMVARRRNEIGIRMALGADRVEVVGLVMREAMLQLVIGLAVGSVLALVATTAAASLLFGLPPQDPVALLSAAALLAAITLGASYLPSYRAAHLDPVAALRQE
jgi:putative ABC transport system permease protein